MNEYSDEHFNKQNANNFNEGATAGIRDISMNYEVNGLDYGQRPHGYDLSLACQSGTDVVHTVGNVTAIALQFILDQFPPGTFATAMPSTRIASRQLRHTPNQIRTQPYPLCIVNPRISLNGLDGRMAAGSFATTTWSTTSNRFQNRSEMPILLFDKRNGIEWRGKINRIVMQLDFVLSFHSAVEQLRWASYLINKIPMEGHPFDIETAMEMALPDGFLWETSKYCGIPVKDESGDVSRFVDYLNMNCMFPVSYRFSSGRHTDAFYAYYMAPILCSISDLTYNAVSKANGLVETDCPVTFTMRCEFSTIGLFDLAVPNPGPFKLLEPRNSSVVIPIFSDVFREEDFPLLYGWKIHARPICKMDWGETEVDISSVLGTTLQQLIDYHLSHKIDPEIMVSVKLRENKCLILDGYYVDWERRRLVFTNINYTHTYRLIIAVNQLYINETLAELYGKT